MGLDMYFTRHVYIGGFYNFKNVTGTCEFEEGPSEHRRTIKLDPKEVEEVVLRVGYLRKANHIHGWIVKNCAKGVDDCREIYLTEAKRKELLELCKSVLADKSSSEIFLPRQNGFFFGDQEYDEWYYEDIKETIKILEKTFEHEDDDFYYRASW